MSESPFVSPNVTQSQLDSGTASLLQVFEDQVKNCILKFANRIGNELHSGIAVLILCNSVLEPLGNMLCGKTSDRKKARNANDQSPELDTQTSSEAFRCGCSFVFNEINQLTVSDNDFATLYSSLRCGLGHEGWIKAGLILEDSSTAIAAGDRGLVINPKLYLAAVEKGFKAYIEQTRNSTDIGRQNFDKYCRFHLGASPAPASPGSLPIIPIGKIGSSGVTVAPTYCDLGTIATLPPTS